MANPVFELFAKLSLDTGDFENKLNSAKGEMEKGWGGIGSAVKTGAKVIAGAVTAAGAATGAFAKAAVDDSIRYETAFTGVTKTVDETATTSYRMLSDAIKKMATETSSSKEIIAGVMEAAGQLGISADDIVGFTKTMVELGDTTNLSAEEAAVALARFTNITGESSGNVDRLGAAIVDLGNNFATDEASIVSMSTRLAAAGTIAGLSSTDILALATAMSSVGIEAEAGGTAMSQVLTKIGNAVAAGVDPSNKKLQTFAQVAGMSAEQFAAAWKTSPVDALSSFIVGLNGITESGENVNEFLSELGINGIRETNMVKSLALASDVLTDAVKTANTAYSENIALNEEAEKRYNTTESKINQLKQAYSNLKILIGDELKPVFRDFLAEATEKVIGFTEKLQNGGLQTALEKIKSGFERIKEALSPLTELFQNFITSENATTTASNLLKGAFDLFVDGLHTASTILATVIEKIGQFVEWLNSGSAGAEAMKAAIVALVAGFAAFEAVNTIIHTVKAAFLALNAVMLANPIALVVAAIAALVAAFVYLWNTNEDFRNFWINLWDSLKEKVSAVIEQIKTVFEALKIAFGAVKDWFSEKIDQIKEAWEGFKNKIAEVGDNIKATWDALVSAATQTTETIKSKWENAKEWGSSLIEKIRGGVSEKASDLISKASEIAKNTRENISENWKGAKTLGSNLIAKLTEGVADKSIPFQERVAKVTENAGKILEKFGEAAKVYGTAITQYLANGIASKASDMYSVVRNMFSEIQNAFRQMIDAARSWGSGLLASFVNGIVERWNDLVSRLNQMAQAVKDRLHFTQPDKGPLSGPHGFESYAPDMMKTFAKGITDNTDLVTNAIGRSFDFGDQIAGFSDGAVVRRGSAQSVGGGVRNMTTILQLDRYTLGRVVYELYNEESQRVGVKLAGGIA